jgi:hypothetical protein
MVISNQGQTANLTIFVGAVVILVSLRGIVLGLLDIQEHVSQGGQYVLHRYL